MPYPQKPSPDQSAALLAASVLSVVITLALCAFIAAVILAP